MKLYCRLILLSCLCYMPVAAFDVSELSILEHSRNLTVKARVELMREVNRKINSSLISASSVDQRLIKQKISHALEGIKGDLVVATGSEDEGLKSLSVQILRHAKIDGQVINALERVAINHSSDKTQSYIVANAIYALAETQALSPEIQLSLVSRLRSSATDNDGLFESWAQLAGFGKVEGAIPILAEALLSDHSYTVICSANALKEMGPLAKNALPILEKLKKQKNGGDFRELEALRYAIISINNTDTASNITRLESSQIKKLESSISQPAAAKPGKPGIFIMTFIGLFIIIALVFMKFTKSRTKGM
jgi:hypothetical protein